MNKKLASSQYAANNFGMSSDGPKRPKKGRGGEKGQDMSCSKDGCATYNTGGGKSNVGRETNRQNKGGAKGLSTRAQYSKKVLKTGSRAEKRWEKKIAKVKANAPARPMTRKEKEMASEMRPSRQDYNDNNVTKSAPKMAKKGLFKRRQVQKITI